MENGGLADNPEDGGFEQSGATAGAWRAFDASANRACEALRVIEDVVRFILDDAHLTGIAKDLRHELAATLAAQELRNRLLLRDVGGDVGVSVEAAAALPRASVQDLVGANAARAGQALRSLHELSLLLEPAVAERFEQLRYRLYALERAAVATGRAVDGLRGVELCVLVDGCGDSHAFERLVESLLEAGVRMLQIRDKRIDVPTLVDRARRAVAIAARRHPDFRPLVIVNDRADVAAAAKAAGVHTGAADMPLPLVRRLLGPRAWLGRTAHDLAEARSAILDGADYLGVGPCFPSATKSFASFAQPEFLAAVAREIAVPAFAIGGITLDRIEQVMGLGFTRVAVASAVTAAPDPAAAAAAFIERIARRESPAPLRPALS
jgi:thiamine-phosphate pyrophosphorylase